MKKIINVENLGAVEANQNIVTGRFDFSIDGKKFVRESKKKYVLSEGEKQIVFDFDGNIFTGFVFSYNGQRYKITNAIPWYVYILTAIPFIMTMVLGNLQTLYDEGFYYVGGAVGGSISGAAWALGIYVSAYCEKLWVRLLICIIAIALTFGICFAVGNIIVSSTK